MRLVGPGFDFEADSNGFGMRPRFSSVAPFLENSSTRCFAEAEKIFSVFRTSLSRVQFYALISISEFLFT